MVFADITEGRILLLVDTSKIAVIMLSPVKSFLSMFVRIASPEPLFVKSSSGFVA